MVMALARETNDATDSAEAERDFQEQLATVSEMDVPGFNVEVFGGNIVVSPFSRWSYFEPLEAALEQLRQHAPEGFRASGTPFKFVFPASHGALGPDLYVVDPALAINDTPLAPCESLALVGEMTSTATRRNDLTSKLDIYGRVVPVYLLFDMKERRLTVYSDPSERGYQTQTTIEFGKPVRIPAPFDFELDTSAFSS
jgi:hypothetical protein